MKSRIWIILIVLLLVASLSVPVFAVSVTNENICLRSERSCVTNNFADDDNDGVCDNRAERAFAGTCGIGQGNRANFVDQDKDDICDNRTEQAFAGTCGIGQSNRVNFVDQDNDGVCDNRGSGTGRQGRCRRQNG